MLLADLHIHTVLSPCASEEMTPSAIVQGAVDKGLSMVAVCDHNSADNAAATQRAARDKLRVIAGIEITTCEEVHLVGLFPSARAAQTVGVIVKQTLPYLPNPRPSWMGAQKLVSSNNRLRSREPRMLASACSFSLEQAVELIHQYQGLAIAAHLDRPSFSVISQLGMLPEGVPFDALEVSPMGAKKGVPGSMLGLGMPIIVSSDAHSPDEIGDGCTHFDVREASFRELTFALRSVSGRRCCVA